LELSAAGVPLVPGELVALGTQDAAGHVLERARALALEVGVVRMRPLMPNHVGADRYARRFAELSDCVGPDGIAARVERIFEVLSSPQVMASGTGTLAGTELLLYGCSDERYGTAASAGLDDGDPDQLSACSRVQGAQHYRVDRRSARVLAVGTGLDSGLAAAAADLADRAQLALGYPVRIEWVMARGRPHVAALCRLPLPVSFTPQSWRRVALVAADEGTVAPLAVDALDRALRVGPSIVRRIYARPYRRFESSGTPPEAAMVSVARATQRATRLGSDVIGPIAVARKLERSARHRLRGFDDQRLSELSRTLLMATMRDREALIREAFVLLDRQLDATRATLSVLSAAVGPLPRAVAPALAAPRVTRARVRALAEMERLWRSLGAPAQLDAATRSAGKARAWETARQRVATLRLLGIDIMPLPFGVNDEHFARALAMHPAHAHENAERARSDVSRRLLATGRSRSIGVGRRSLAASLVLVLGRLASAKGSTAEVLAAAMLRLRAAAVEVGARLAEEGLLEEAEDALYLTFTELEEAIRLEPGAYASRARFRREDDRRWRAFAAPDRVGGADAS